MYKYNFTVFCNCHFFIEIFLEDFFSFFPAKKNLWSKKVVKHALTRLGEQQLTFRSSLNFCFYFFFSYKLSFS